MLLSKKCDINMIIHEILFVVINSFLDLKTEILSSQKNKKGSIKLPMNYNYFVLSFHIISCPLTINLMEKNRQFYALNRIRYYTQFEALTF